MSRPAPLSEAVASKASLRAAALARRAAMGAEARAAAARAAAERAVAALDGAAGKAVGLFATFRDEIDTGPLADLLWAAGATVALPVMVARDAPLLFRRWQAGDTLALSAAYAIPEPGPQAPEVDPEFLLVPLAAFDRKGFRIGYGAGFYDRTLARLRACRRVTAIGYAFACQEVERVPAEAHDERVDLVVTEAETIRIPPRTTAF